MLEGAGLLTGSCWESRQHVGLVIRLDRVVGDDVLVTVVRARDGAVRPAVNAVRYLSRATLLSRYEPLDVPLPSLVPPSS